MYILIILIINFLLFYFIFYPINTTLSSLLYFIVIISSHHHIISTIIYSYYLIPTTIIHHIISTPNKSTPTTSTPINPTAAIHNLSATCRPNNTKRPPIIQWNRNFIEFRSETRGTRIQSKTLDNLWGSLQQTHWKRTIQSNREAIFVYVCL